MGPSLSCSVSVPRCACLHLLLTLLSRPSTALGSHAPADPAVLPLVLVAQIGFAAHREHYQLVAHANSLEVLLRIVQQYDLPFKRLAGLQGEAGAGIGDEGVFTALPCVRLAGVKWGGGEFTDRVVQSTHVTPTSFTTPQANRHTGLMKPARQQVLCFSTATCPDPRLLTTTLCQRTCLRCCPGARPLFWSCCTSTPWAALLGSCRPATSTSHSRSCAWCATWPQTWWRCRRCTRQVPGRVKEGGSVLRCRAVCGRRRSRTCARQVHEGLGVTRVPVHVVAAASRKIAQCNPAQAEYMGNQQRGHAAVFLSLVLRSTFSPASLCPARFHTPLQPYPYPPSPAIATTRPSCLCAFAG